MVILLLSLVLQQPSPSGEYPGGSAPTVPIPRIEADAVVDGVLDEPAWSQASRLTDFSQYEPVDGRPAEERTEVLVWYAPDAIWFGIHAYDTEPDAIRATRADRDNIDNDDNVLIYLDTFNDRRRAFFFGVNPLGVQQDGVRTEGAVSPGRIFGGNIDTNPDYLYESRGHVTSDGYVVEVRIPFKSLRYPGSGPQTWGLNIVRKTQRTGYTDTWTDVRRANASFLLQSGTITGLHDLERGVVLEAQPFVTATANGALDPASGGFERNDLDPEAGLNLRLGFSNLSLDATLNPDFSQVESDASQVTVNQRFALFFPEKRPFFLEGIELFATPNQLVHTRQIVNPIAGGKVTGKVGPLAIAHLTAVDEGFNGAPDALFNVTRLRRDFGSNSLAGFTFTDRSELDSPGYNRVAAGDVRIVFGKLYYFEGQAGGSWTRDALGTRAAPLWRMSVDRTGRSWGFNYELNGIGEDFVTRAGYVPRSDIVNAHAFNRLSWYGARGALMESFRVFFGAERIWAYGAFPDDGTIEGNESADASLRLRGGWELGTHIERDFVDLDPADYADYQTIGAGGPTPYHPLESVSGPSIRLSVTTPTFQRLDANASFQLAHAAIFPEGGEGRAVSANATVALRPTPSLRIAFTGAVEHLERSRDGSEFARTIIPRLKVELQPKRSLFFRVVGEYRSERRAALEDVRTGEPLAVDGRIAGPQQSDGLRVDLLASFQPTPGTVAFFGYGSSLAADRSFGFSDLERTTDGFFIKLAYQFRR